MIAYYGKDLTEEEVTEKFKPLPDQRAEIIWDWSLPGDARMASDLVPRTLS